MRKRAIIIVISVATVFAIYHFVLWYDLRHNGVLVEGVVLSSVYSAKSSQMQFRYRYFYMGKVRINDRRAGVKYPAEFYGKSFPVVVSSITKRSIILITPKHFKRFNLRYPDSLKWVLQYIE